MTFHTTDPNIQRVVNEIYGKAINFTYYSDPIFSADGSSITFNTTKKKLNLMQAAAEYFLQGLALANKDSITQQEYQGKYINQGFKSVYNVEN